jgi:hypothetical protein
MLKATPHPDHPPKDGKYNRGNDDTPVAVSICLNHDAEKIPPEIDILYSPNGIMWRNHNKLMANTDVEEALIGFEEQIVKVLKQIMYFKHASSNVTGV